VKEVKNAEKKSIKRRENWGKRSKKKKVKERSKTQERQGVLKKPQITGEHRGSFFDPFITVKKNKRRKERKATGKSVKVREVKGRTFNSSAQLQRLCFVCHLPVAKEAHVSCLSIFGYYLLQTGSAGISPNLSSFVIFLY
jgi:hypothetical protein